MSTIATALVQALAEHGVTQVWGVVGDALNPVTDAIRTDDRLQWVGVRHEEVAAFAAGAQSQLTGRIGVCMGTVGPGSIHLLNGLYDAKKSHAPVLAICGQVPQEEIGSDFFQEVDNDSLFKDVAVYSRTVTSPAQMPQILEQAVNAAYAESGVAVITLPGDVGSLELPDDTPAARLAPGGVLAAAPEAQVEAAAQALAEGRVTLLVGRGARHARTEVLQLAETLQAPMVLTLKGKEGLEHDNPYQVGQSGLIGNPAAAHAMDDCDVLFLVGTDFPYRDWYPTGKTVVQLDATQAHVGRRVSVQHALVGDSALTLQALLPRLAARRDGDHLERARAAYDSWRERQDSLLDPKHDTKLLGRIRSVFDNPDRRIRPEALAATLDRLAADDAIFTSDTGMSTAWLARFITMRGRRQLLGSYNLGSMANAMPQALGAQALDRGRQVVACCGDGGLMMLLGDLRTAVTYGLPVTLVVFDNGRLGMVKLEQEQGGLPEFGTELDNPDLAAVATAMGLEARRVEDPTELDEAVAWALATDRPVLLDVVTNPDEVAVPPKPTVSQGWGFAIAKTKEAFESA
ncbi:thiamine pyrophosphate-dependent enzyme [Arsenicicoccus sp. oral taxon 190]|uniref:thiamine pyrophosphate-dependent enzyme n=1 Tax=Arsenicicoccus sp. oral taxon 190 TaxID=1658671 RepID=UPI00067A193A|nr:thiamine pyrophosphate-dependent enzyme [Arsenicicoccus sp. oral taxon 190]AKT51020.1 thiamine pyrophosphate-binding protein [Arsenicicoccus sp. oral taxon 190]